MPTTLKTLALLFGLLPPLAPWAQNNTLQVNLPEGQHLCGSADSVRLGAAVSGGVSPYRYVWSMRPRVNLSSTWHASDFLNDTTRAQPLLYTPGLDSLYLRLTVRDSLGAEAMDSMLITHSQMTIHLGQWSATIENADTVQLPGPNVGSSYPLDSVEWSPARGLVNRHARRPLATPDSNVNYRARIWGSQGCSQDGGTFVFISVDELGLEEPAERAFEVFPTHLRAGDQLRLRGIHAGPFQLSLRDARGQEVKRWRRAPEDPFVRLPAGLRAGLYFLQYQGPEATAVRRLLIAP